jgi:hypothetical protein
MLTQAIRKRTEIEFNNPGAMNDQGWQHNVDPYNSSTAREDLSLCQTYIIDCLETFLQCSELRNSVSYRTRGND